MTVGPRMVTPGDDDFVLPFQVDAPDLRGRLVRLGPAMNDILNRHSYPEPVANLLAEAMALANCLSDMLKYDGVFSLQARGDGPVKLLVTDVTTGGEMRAYAEVDWDAYRAALTAAGGEQAVDRSVPKLLGGGYLAFTVDQGDYAQLYQGIVALDGQTLSDCVHHYFQQSEQLQTVIKVVAAKDERVGDVGPWRAGGLMIQRLPKSEGRTEHLDEEAEDAWRRTAMLLSTASKEELLSATLPPEQLLFRLFHEDGVRVYPPHPVRDVCRCSAERVGTVLAQQDRAELEDLKVDGAVVVTCQFCSREYRFDDTDLDKLAQAATH